MRDTGYSQYTPFFTAWRDEYDPTDYDCGCTDRLDELAASTGGWRVWRLGTDAPAEFPLGEFDAGAHWREPAALPEPNRQDWLSERCGDPDDDGMHADPCDDDCDLERELDEGMRRATGGWR